MEKRQRIIMISVICVVICVILAVILVMVIPKPEEQEEPKPWWEQDDKLLIVLEDDRSVEKTYSYKPNDYVFAKFNYTEDKNDPRECIPEFKIYYDGEEKTVYMAVVRREIYYENLDSYQSIGSISGIGKFKVKFRWYLTNIDAAKMENEIGGVTIDIIISKGIEG